jgi:hypothetical protein
MKCNKEDQFSLKILEGNELDALQKLGKGTLQETMAFQKTNMTEMSTLTKGYVHFD